MARLEPTATRMIRPAWALQVPSPAHDSLGPVERRRHIAEHPYSFLTVTRGPEDLDPGQEWESAPAVRASQAALDRLLQAGAFSDVAPPALYLYRLSFSDGTDNGRSQIGIVGGIAVDDYEQGVIRVHEEVHETRAQHLADHLEGLQIQSSPIALAHRADPGLSQLVASIAAGRDPVLDFTAADGLRQQIWVVDDPDQMAQLQAALAPAPLYLIDGHHRAAAAARNRRRAAAPGADWMLSVVFAAEELHNESFHRLLHRIDPEKLLDQLRSRYPLRTDCTVEQVLDRGPDELALLTGSRWHLVDLGPNRAPSPLSGLDSVRLERQLLRALLGLSTAEQNSRLSYRFGDPGPEELRHWTTGPDQALWLMRPVPVETLLDVADDGALMPPKSTYFQPKVRSGVFLRPLQ